MAIGEVAQVRVDSIWGSGNLNFNHNALSDCCDCNTRKQYGYLLLSTSTRCAVRLAVIDICDCTRFHATCT